MTLLTHLAVVLGAFAAGYASASWQWRRVVARHLRALRRIGDA